MWSLLLLGINFGLVASVLVTLCTTSSYSKHPEILSWSSGAHVTVVSSLHADLKWDGIGRNSYVTGVLGSNPNP